MRHQFNKTLLFILLTTLSCLCFARPAKVNYSCEDNNRVLLIIDPSNTEKIDAIRINNDEYLFCDSEGDVFTFMKSLCRVGNPTIKFNMITKEIEVKQSSRATVLKCR